MSLLNNGFRIGIIKVMIDKGYRINETNGTNIKLINILSKLT